MGADMIKRFRRSVHLASTSARRIVGRRGSARHATSRLPSRRSLPTWIAATSDDHERYRAATPIPNGDVAVVCVSRRPLQLSAVLDAVERQRDVTRSLVFVADHEQIDLDEVVEMAERRGLSGTVALRTGPGMSLGASLNAALASTDARFVAKFDDDDTYGAFHLADSLRAFGYSGAGIVGKHTYYVHFTESDRTVLRFPGHEFTYTSTLSGATLVWDRQLLGNQLFENCSIGEDRAFIRAALRRGIPTFSADRFNFVVERHNDHSWDISEHDLARDALDVNHDDPHHRIDR